MPSLKDRDLNAALDSASPGPPARPVNPQQTVALEVPVTVNGARTLDGNEQREPFSESTKTVLVHSNGAVIRLAATVAPGQLLFLTNEKTKKEVVCQVLQSKTAVKANGYVELQFTEPNPGFWGARSPSEPGRRPDSLLSPDPTDFLAAALPAPSAGPAQRSESKAPGAYKSEPQKDLAGTSSRQDSLKTDLKPDQRATHKADLLAPAETPTESLKLEANRLQEQLSSLLFTEPEKAPSAKPSPSGSSSKALSDTTAKLFEIGEANAEAAQTASDTSAGIKAPAASKPSFDAAKSALGSEELKVPSWLEPLTHNAPPAAALEDPASAKATSPATDAVPTTKSAEKPEPQQKQAKPALSKTKASAAPIFGKTLLAQNAVTHASSHGSNRGLLIGIAVGVVLVAAAGAAWYFHQSFEPSASNEALARVSHPASPAPSATGTNTVPAIPAASAETSSATQLAQDVRSTGQPPKQTAGAIDTSSSLSAPQIKAQPAVLSERVPNPSPIGDSARASAQAAANDTTEPAIEVQPTRPSLGRVRLAKPKVHRGNQAGDIDAPSLADSESEPVPADASLGTGLAAETAAQPFGPPTPVGGDAKPARLLSSVPPVYPSFARTQHVSGEVRIDALIDATGRVSAMKVISGPGLLHQAAMDALRQWKYQPAMLNGSPVATHLTVTLQFHLQ